jgi:hypothetical protein
MLMPFFEGHEMISPSSYPDPSLALTSALGNIFLPFTEDIISKTVSPEYLQSVGRLYFFRVSLLLEEPNLINALEKSGKDIVLLEQVFLLCAYAKDKLSLPLANALWSDGIGLDGDDFIGFQSDCFELLGRVWIPNIRVDSSYPSLDVRILLKNSKLWQKVLPPRDIMPLEFSAIFSLSSFVPNRWTQCL